MICGVVQHIGPRHSCRLRHSVVEKAKMANSQIQPVPKRPKIFEILGNWIGVIPFFIFIFIFLILPSTNLFIGAFKDSRGNFTFDNIIGLKDPYILKAYSVSLQVSVITSLVGSVFGFFVAYAITIGKAPKWMRNILMTFSGLAANFGGVPLAFAFIATVGRTGFITAILKNICFPDASGVQVCPFNPYEHGFNLYSVLGLTLAYTYFEFPLMVLIITPALEGLKRDWREASDNLGANSWQYWRYIAFPVLWPSLLGAGLLLFGSAFGAFATAEALTGGSVYLVTILIGQQIRGDVLGNQNLGYALALGMVVIMSITITGYTVLQRRTVRWLKS
jgi:putative spermidine/putrescine transport system permease protein